MLAFYDRANAQNVIAFTALAGAMTEGLPARSSTPARGIADAHTASSLVPLPLLTELSAEHRDKVMALAALHPEHAFGITPSLYLHLANWPLLLDRAFDRLQPYVRSAAWDLRKRNLLTAVAGLAGGMRVTLSSGVPTPDAAHRAYAARVLERFITGTIPDMLLVGAYLEGDRAGAG